MAKERVNKTKAVAVYLKSHPTAMASEIAAALGKQGIKITPGHVANIKSKIKRLRAAGKAQAAKPSTAAPDASAATVAEKPAKPGDAITLDQIKKVAQTVKAIGGFDRLKELLEVVREVGGLKKFRDLLEAMASTEAGAVNS